MYSMALYEDEHMLQKEHKLHSYSITVITIVCSGILIACKHKQLLYAIYDNAL